MQFFFTHDLRRTTTNTVAKFIALAGARTDCAASSAIFGACKKALFHRMFCNSRLASDLRVIGRARSGVASVNDVVMCAHDVSKARAIHIA
jgi:hypothetical protein